MLLLGTLPLGLSSPWLTPALLLPVAAFVWVLRARVVATPLGCEVCNGLRVRRFGWADVAAFDVPTKGPVVLRPTTGRSVRLTALPRAELRRFLAVGNPA